MNGGFQTMSAVTRDIPLIARHATRDPADTRRRLQLDLHRPLVLVSFGGYGLQLAPDVTTTRESFSVVGFDGLPPGGLTYADLVAASDAVVSKPGYGIISDCIANNTALVYTSRGRFVEYDVLVAEMPRFLRCEYISQEDLREGRWSTAIERVLQKSIPQRPRTDGAEVAANALLNLTGLKAEG
jgi:L-arabinokinase